MNYKFVVCAVFTAIIFGFKYYIDPLVLNKNIPQPDYNKTSEKGFQLGRMLFYDPILSGNNKMSCSTCHKQEFAFTDTLRYNKGINGKTLKRNTMSLVNLAWNKNLFWDGRVHSIEEQIFFPITHPDEMAQDLNTLVKELNSHNKYPELFKKAFGKNEIDTTQIKYALAQFIRSIVSMDSPMDRVFADPKMRVIDEHKSSGSADSDFDVMVNLFDKGLTSQELFVKNAMGKANNKKVYSEKALKAFVLCIQCHDKNFMGDATSMKNDGLELKLKDVGLGAITDNSLDSGLFKVPTLRNIFHTAPYMHDGRFKTMDEVLEHYNSGIQNHPNLDPLLKNNGKPIRLSLSKIEKEELKEFLSLTTDDSLFNNKRYSNPFQN